MKSAIIALCIVGCAYAAFEKDAKVVKSFYENIPFQGFQAAWETENGISGQTVGQLKQIAPNEQSLDISGSSQYTGTDGRVYTMTYVADENGYRPVADYLPTPPPTQEVPAYILRALEYIKEHPYKEVKGL